jgi:hypothetical protein
MQRQPLVWLIGMIVYSGLILNGARLLQDPGTYWHIAVGRFILEHHAIPFHEPFSYTMAGTLWTSNEWAAEWLIAVIYDLCGWRGVILLTALCGALAFALFARALLRSLATVWVLILSIATVPLVFGHVLARPHTLALPLIVLWIAGLARAADEHRAPTGWLLPVMWLWANLHGGYTLGLVLAALFAAEAWLQAAPATRRNVALEWGSFGLLAFLASMLTADGPAGFLFSLKTVGNHVAMHWIQEWAPLNFQAFQPMEVWLFALLFGGLTLGIRLPWTRVAMVLLLIYLALAHVRFVENAALLAPLILAGPLGAELRRRGFAATSPPRQAIGAGMRPGAIIALLAIAPLAVTAVSFAHPLDRTDDSRTPASALAAARRLRPCGNMLNQDLFGGYLIFRGIKTFIDDRTEMYGDEFLQAYVDAVLLRDVTLPAFLRRYDIGWTLFAPGEEVNEVLDHLPGWKRVYADRSAVVHMRDDAGSGCVPHPPVPVLGYNGATH